MPLVDITYPHGALTADARATLAEELTTVLLRAENLPDTALFRGMAWMYVHELPEGMVLSAGRPVTEPTFRIEVTVLAGGLCEQRKESLLAEVTNAVLDAAGLDRKASRRVWVLVREVPDGNWGSAGRVASYQQLVQLAADQGVPAMETPGPHAVGRPSP